MVGSGCHFSEDRLWSQFLATIPRSQIVVASWQHYQDGKLQYMHGKITRDTQHGKLKVTLPATEWGDLKAPSLQTECVLGSRQHWKRENIHFMVATAGGVWSVQGNIGQVWRMIQVQISITLIVCVRLVQSTFTLVIYMTTVKIEVTLVNQNRPVQTNAWVANCFRQIKKDIRLVTYIRPGETDVMLKV